LKANSWTSWRLQAKQSTQSTTHKAGDFNVAAAFDRNDDGLESCDIDNAETMLFFLAVTNSTVVGWGWAVFCRP
jgi:hypothetical protein